MVPTLSGRIQTRIFTMLVIGGLWTLLITPILPTGAPLGDSYRTTFIVIIAAALLGVLWELVYHGLQQFRWEKDWPTMFGLLNGLNEGLLLWILASAGAIPGINQIPGWAFVIHFGTTWLIIWLITNGPMRVPFLRWRIQGGRLI